MNKKAFIILLVNDTTIKNEENYKERKVNFVKAVHSSNVRGPGKVNFMEHFHSSDVKDADGGLKRPGIFFSF